MEYQRLPNGAASATRVAALFRRSAHRGLPEGGRTPGQPFAARRGMVGKGAAATAQVHQVASGGGLARRVYGQTD